MTTPIVTPYPNTEFEKRLHRLQRQRDLALRGLEKDRMSPELAEALRNEIRRALDADGKPFDVNVARRVYDLAIAAKDMCAAATAGVGEAIKTIADQNGPTETLGELEPDAPAVQAQASETFGARLIRELLATFKLTQPKPVEDPKALVHALAEARRNGMTDVAEELEIKLFGKTLPMPGLDKPIAPVIVEGTRDVEEGSWEHGFADGKANKPPFTQTGDYHHGYLKGLEAHYLDAGAIARAQATTGIGGLGPEALTSSDSPLCEACLKDPDPRGGSACFQCREIASHRGHMFRHAFKRRQTNYFAGPVLETCEWCGTDPRNAIHIDHEQAVRQAHDALANGVTII